MCYEPKKEKKIPWRLSGYKVFRVDGKGKLRGEFARRYKERKRGVWLKEKDFRPIKEELLIMGGSKRKGWRVFLSERGAHKWDESVDTEVVRVMIRNILSVGMCGGFGAAILVKEIFIPNEG